MSVGWGEFLKIWWSQGPWARAMRNDDNPVNGNHTGTVTLLTSET